MLKIELIPDIKKAWKYLSVVSSALAIIASTTLEMYGTELPGYVYSIMFAVVLACRLINQESPDDNAN